jgi:predicted pyridoxine 5'-phosphate oxidase superfamily flavin-nucleotide-binding protein
MFSRIEPALQEFIERQRIFFTGSATADSLVNVSPKGSDSLRVIGPNAVAEMARPAAAMKRQPTCERMAG